MSYGSEEALVELRFPSLRVSDNQRVGDGFLLQLHPSLKPAKKKEKNSKKKKRKMQTLKANNPISLSLTASKSKVWWVFVEMEAVCVSLACRILR